MVEHKTEVLLAEFHALRNELLNRSTAQGTLLGMVILGTTAVLGWSVQSRNVLILPLSYGVIIPLGIALYHNRLGAYKIGAYIRYRLEEQFFGGLLRWESSAHSFEVTRVVEYSLIFGVIACLPLLTLGCIVIITSGEGKWDGGFWRQPDICIALALNIILTALCYVVVVRPLGEKGSAMKRRLYEALKRASEPKDGSR